MNQSILEERTVEMEQREHLNGHKVNDEEPKKFIERYGNEYYQSVINYVLKNGNTN